MHATNAAATHELLTNFKREYRAEVLREAADATDKLAMEFREADETDEWPEEWSSREVMEAVREVAGEMRRMAEGEGER
jgi:hypothetical protein